MNFISFDLESCKEIPEGETDWKKHRPLGISCACFSHGPDNYYVFASPDENPMPETAVRELVSVLDGLVKRGYTIVTHNGASFDFDILAEESGLYEKCRELMLASVDTMALVVARRGHYLGLDKAAAGMGVKGKMKQVRLNSGGYLDGMGGAKAPQLWREGERSAVIDYLKEDCRVTLELVNKIVEHQGVGWMSGSDKWNWVAVQVMAMDDLLEQDYELPHWVTNPVMVRDLVRWALP